MIALLMMSAQVDYWGSPAQMAHDAWVKCINNNISSHKGDQSSPRVIAKEIVSECQHEQKIAQDEFFKLKPSQAERNRVGDFYSKAEVMVSAAVEDARRSSISKDRTYAPNP